MNPGDTIMIYLDPVAMKLPEGQAKLIELQRNIEGLEQWIVEFLDSPGNYYPRLIKT